ncbi:MAG: hypothetical protein A2600_01720 [Candidatus Lambdaproteobacteria bacterium RIFOXYD1_FULL_56_27]|uniref:ABC transporter domain-containing protein n=1 Tax=Candidatus Lambdaproteobacteria bacterium RIFOXYD2_FULL_56_26 TaxID=1817773 RepID=A0A1F6GMU6_9PROT|nr:MAG: hypothetical protein A2557_12710 [Candidatus Lambdaproteobacteria bacterium RIFOXYD2_FULL_56_26]OGH05563.1 MAG: hypothetical protein A2426_04510 [Candidatus Lambdaproteobacteria bacterium RIFOXYC1_FULL_56_13]OGH08522.1 MAG: hypothetical protein A2600_01720 [Candidatus Lambdaproteobacteria bacterium RIFOXYD1_FULL_56_27]
MSLLVSCKDIEKAFGAEPLFYGISLGIHEGEKLGLIGANGSGKSTLLKLLSGEEEPDQGEVVFRRGLKVSRLAQAEAFGVQATVGQVLEQAAAKLHLDPEHTALKVEDWIAQAGFTGRDQLVSSLSGGYAKRLSIAKVLIQEPELLLLDEPTNHLDLEGILWLEKLLAQAEFAFVLISHDRQLLERVPKKMIEVGSHYPEGYLAVPGHWSDFLAAKEKFLEDQLRLQSVLSNKLRRENEWLSRGPKARGTKARGRIDAAADLDAELRMIKNLNRPKAKLGLDFVATGRQTRRLLEAYNLGLKMGERTLFQGLNLKLTNGSRLGLLGRNGSGKTSLLRLLQSQLAPTQGTLKTAEDLKIEVFDQHRLTLDPSWPLKNALSQTGESVVYQGKEVHIVTWAKRFLFSPSQLELPIGTLSGGEQARVQIARLMLSPADLLLLDEPTNDLDIPALEVLEESLMEFQGAIVLVTHDRALLSRVATGILGLGPLEPQLYASFDQWQAAQTEPKTLAPTAAPNPKAAPKPKGGLSYNEQKELRTLEAKVEKAEAELAEMEAQMTRPEMAQDHQGLEANWKKIQSQKNKVEALYARWHELESKAGG